MTADRIKSLKIRDELLVVRLTDIWESSVRGTHTFLNENDIAGLKPEVGDALISIQQLFGYQDEKGAWKGFVGIDGQKVEMLFIDGKARGQGISRQLMDFVIRNYGIDLVDVNEQNEQGVGFYIHMGFRVVSRSEYDEQGRHFPILHLALDPALK